MCIGDFVVERKTTLIRPIFVQILYNVMFGFSKHSDSIMYSRVLGKMNKTLSMNSPVGTNKQ